MRRSLAVLPYLLLPAALFLALFHVAALDIRNAGWLIRGTDNGENALGLHAYLHDPAAGASLRTGLLNAPDGVPLLFTDSNPLVAMLARPFAGWLPADAQFVGPWFLLCLTLQMLFAWLLLRRHAPGPLALWAGTALLCVLPTLFNRFIHANLFAHWLLLWALWLFLDPRRAGQARWWLPLLAITALVHSYLLVMVGAVWASATIERGVALRGVRRWRLAGKAVAALVMVAAIALWIGAGGRYALAGNYGAFAMPLDALVNPANPSFSTLLPATPQREGRGFEGFQYLGAGLLVLLVVAAVLAGRLSPAHEERGIHRRLLWLAPALVALTLLAISNYPDLAGHRLPRFALPAALAPLLDMVRASGRLFWPVAYTLVLAALLVVFRLPPRRSGMLLAGLLALQLIDIAGMFFAIRPLSADAGRLYLRTTDVRWDAAIAASRDVTFEPAAPTADLQLFQEVAWRAASQGRPVRTVYAARTPLASVERLARDHAAFLRGDLAADRLYVLLPSSPLPAAAHGRVAVLDGMRVILPMRAAGPSSPRSAS